MRLNAKQKPAPIHENGFYSGRILYENGVWRTKPALSLIKSREIFWFGLMRGRPGVVQVGRPPPSWKSNRAQADDDEEGEEGEDHGKAFLGSLGRGLS